MYVDELTVREAARQLGVCENTVRNWCDRGKLDHRKLPSGTRRIKRRSVLRWKRVVDDSGLGLLQCVDCTRRTTELEAYSRNFNRGRCGHCQGELKPV